MLKKSLLIVGFCALLLVGCNSDNDDSSERLDPGFTLDKPVICLYPEDETDILVELGSPERLLCSYPKYDNGWSVTAYPDGSLDYGGKSLYCLYYESEMKSELGVETEGFCVKGSDSAEFLEEKLSLLGLSDRECEEFIIYWLPKLECNEYNYIRFASSNEIEDYMGLSVTPVPDTCIRVLMLFKGLDSPISVSEQNLTLVERIGYTVVEWGGVEIE